MTYARSRLWLGITGVGTFVVIATTLIFTRAHESLLSTGTSWRASDIYSLILLLLAFTFLMVPLDLLGGYVLPKKHGRSNDTFWQFLSKWFPGTSLQLGLYLATGIALLAVGRSAGLVGVLVTISLLSCIYVGIQGLLLQVTNRPLNNANDQLLDSVVDSLKAKGFRARPIVVVDHTDPGYTGGIIGLPGFERIVFPHAWLSQLSAQEIEAVIARRLYALESGSRRNGLILAVFWIVAGFALSTFLPGAGIDSVAALCTSLCGFTLWTFLGLLVLPTASRQASYFIDSQVMERGISTADLGEAISKLDRLQDDEPKRSSLVETIFHPVPSSGNRADGLANPPTFAAWHLARNVLFLSWACMGLLSRAVHCNAGRPELWVLLPCD